MMFRFPGATGSMFWQRLRLTLGRSLTLKFMVASAILVLPLSGAFWYRSLLSEERHLTGSAVDFAAAFTEVVKKSVREEMLHNDVESLQRSVLSFAGSETLRDLRIYGRRGAVAYSSDPKDIGRKVSRDELPCVGCHDDPQRPRETLHEPRRFMITADADGRRVLSYVEPILNEPACSAAACHDGGVRVLGIMLAEFPLMRLDLRVERQVREFSLFVLLYIVALATVGYLIVWRIVLRPVSALARGVEKVAAGDLSQRVPVISADEIGRLAGNFNAMTMEIAASRRRMEHLAQGLERQVAAKTAEVRQTEGRLAESEKLAALGRLTAEIAHEIRNPLTALGGYGRRLLRTVSTDTEKEYARIVVDEASRLEELLADVLDYSRPERYSLARLPVTQILRESLAAFGERCAERGIALETDFQAGEPVFIDPGHVRRAVDNLMANAIDAMPQGGKLRVTTQLASARCLRFVVVVVEDTGPGIKEADLARICEPFWTTKKVGEGTGLGLPITRKIVEAHGGFMSITNRPEGGLAAGLWFPYQDDAALARPACWEAVHCGRAGEDAADSCPAWPHFGRACWAVAGTLCGSKPTGTQAGILGDCGDCGFFREMVPPEED